VIVRFHAVSDWLEIVEISSGICLLLFNMSMCSSVLYRLHVYNLVHCFLPLV